MIESIDTIVQIAALLFCAGISLWQAIRHQSRAWVLAVFFFGSYMLGDIFWMVCLIFYGKTPQISVISDLSWYASYSFLYLLLLQTAPTKAGEKRHFLQWLGPAVSVALAIFFMQWGEILSNLIYAAIIGLVFFASIGRLVERDRYHKQRFLAVMAIVICMMEYGLWFSSGLFEGETLANPYYWFDMLLTVNCLISLLAIKKAVTK
ncbi:MAG: hypothetical protein IK125_00640 [Lachnospiraceae bacterium]|nr:hypothetical protein [Lachnospiraceae bacterium]